MVRKAMSASGDRMSESSELVKVQSGELILPKPRNEGASIALRRIGAIIKQLPSTVDSAAWAAAVIAEANNCDATPMSIATCVYNCSFLGLMPGAALGHCHFIPFKDKNNKKQAQLVIGYKGWTHLAYQTNYIKDLFVDVVCEGEHVELWTDEHGQHIKHVPNWDREPSRKNIIGAFCIWHTTSGGRSMRIINRNDIKKSDKGCGVWLSDFEPMVRKTAVLRSAKTWNTTARLARAIYLDEQAERDEEQSLPDGIDLGDDIGPASGWKLPSGDE